MKDKICYNCGDTFTPNSGIQKYCMDCRKIIRKQQGEKADKKFRLKHPDRVKKTKHKQYLKNPYTLLSREEKDKVNERKRLTYWGNVKVIRENERLRHIKWRSTKRGRFLSNLRNYRRRAKEKILIHSFTPQEWIRKVDETKGICPMCKEFVGKDKLTLDHIVPIYLAPTGYEYTINDVQPLCKSCNSSKGYANK